MPDGTIVRIDTESGNCYLFEVTTDSWPHVAHVVRCESREGAPNTGYRGHRKISSDAFSVGKQVFHGNSNTSPVVRITLLKTQIDA